MSITCITVTQKQNLVAMYQRDFTSEYPHQGCCSRYILIVNALLGYNGNITQANHTRNLHPAWLSGLGH